MLHSGWQRLHARRVTLSRMLTPCRMSHALAELMYRNTVSGKLQPSTSVAASASDPGPDQTRHPKRLMHLMLFTLPRLSQHYPDADRDCSPHADDPAWTQSTSSGQFSLHAAAEHPAHVACRAPEPASRCGIGDQPAAAAAAPRQVAPTLTLTLTLTLTVTLTLRTLTLSLTLTLNLPST